MRLGCSSRRAISGNGVDLEPMDRITFLKTMRAITKSYVFESEASGRDDGRGEVSFHVAAS